MGEVRGVPAKEQRDASVGQIHGEAAETQRGGALRGVHDGVHVVREEELKEAHAHEERNDEQNARPALHMPRRGKQTAEHDDGEPGEIGRLAEVARAFLHERGGEQSEQRHASADDAEPHFLDADEAVVVAGDGQKEPDHAVEDESEQDEREGSARAPDPAAGAQDGGDGFPHAGEQRQLLRRMPCLTHAQRDDEAGDRAAEAEQPGQFHAELFGKRDAEPRGEMRVIVE